ncbi:MAG: hypothetical protein ACO3K7_06915 [Candidatus Marinamargulisbacteria bacterium]
MWIWFIILIGSVFIDGNSEFQDWRRYRPSDSPTRLPHVVVFVSQLSIQSTSRELLPLLIKKRPIHASPMGWVDFLRQQYANGYELFMSSHYNPNELWGMGRRYIHHYRTHQERLNTMYLASERQMIRSAFQALDNVIIQKKTYRPICLIIVLPPQAMHSLGRGGVAKTSFNARRDFSVAYVYHELHKRRYLYPANVMIYSKNTPKGIFVLKKP